jgi:hypothetical protein
MSRFNFAFAVSQVENGSLIATCRDLPDLRVKGKNRNEVLATAQNEIEMVFLCKMQALLDLPAPSAAAISGELSVSVPAVTALRARMYERSRLQLAEKLAQFDCKRHGGEYIAFPRVGREIWD